MKIVRYFCYATKLSLKRIRLLQHPLISHRNKINFVNHYLLNFNYRSKLSEAFFSTLIFITYTLLVHNTRTNIVIVTIPPLIAITTKCSFRAFCRYFPPSII